MNQAGEIHHILVKGRQVKGIFDAEGYLQGLKRS
ncbi:hypothetical protein SVI_3242 [Shewanella violacea DSS12]|uniref:Uncharacterized protein n=1 Tax=Shewanella violacea (strain JCM 10179 / CIP 106290 / LMG 19151 / DSS12) TaxID=637905 RepID=D4ZB18_SHEVD|nr:hypothetical protein SVI_3242 [Shewanella violacea DSS12]